MSTPLIQRQTTLPANIVALCRFLRSKGFTIGPREEADALHALSILSDAFSSPMQMQLCLKSTLARTYAQLMVFDELYQQYWRELAKAVDSKVKHAEEESKEKKPAKSGTPGLYSIKNWLQGNTAKDEAETATYSTQTVLSRKDFSLLAEEELTEMAIMVQRIARTLALRESRRQKASKKPLQLDLRRTLRRNMRCGGDLIALVFGKPARQKKQIILLCDVSKSMDLYSRFLLQFIYAFQSGFRRIEAFAFSTALYRVTPAFRKRDFKSALEEVSAQVTGWSGGTKIGESLNTFYQRYGRRMLNRQTVVVIMSDGWDTGDIELLERNMRRIKSKSAKVIWLNPLAGSSRFKPETKGMQTAMPYIDVFAPGHSVESLRQLYHRLG
ncbi:MAG: VWA domain-containing protein [Phaeodactylibacter sp.]|nr:VWA domain-containing protein [Phaeodactylibacter sp.]